MYMYTYSEKGMSDENVIGEWTECYTYIHVHVYMYVHVQPVVQMHGPSEERNEVWRVAKYSKAFAHVHRLVYWATRNGMCRP